MGSFQQDIMFSLQAILGASQVSYQCNNHNVLGFTSGC
jgi:hypothetical protein